MLQGAKKRLGRKEVKLYTIKENPYMPKNMALLVNSRPPWEGGDHITILDFRTEEEKEECRKKYEERKSNDL